MCVPSSGRTSCTSRWFASFGSVPGLRPSADCYRLFIGEKVCLPVRAQGRRTMKPSSVPDLGAVLEESGGILRGHFLLTSGRHSPVYFEKFRILEQPRLLSGLCSA